jgi:hypothetical protein
VDRLRAANVERDMRLTCNKHLAECEADVRDRPAERPRRTGLKWGLAVGAVVVAFVGGAVAL